MDRDTGLRCPSRSLKPVVRLKKKNSHAVLFGIGITDNKDNVE
jgi:hypothetical protein